MAQESAQPGERAVLIAASQQQLSRVYRASAQEHSFRLALELAIVRVVAKYHLIAVV